MNCLQSGEKRSAARLFSPGLQGPTMPNKSKIWFVKVRRLFTLIGALVSLEISCKAFYIFVFCVLPFVGIPVVLMTFCPNCVRREKRSWYSTLFCARGQALPIGRALVVVTQSLCVSGHFPFSWVTEPEAGGGEMNHHKN